MYSFLLSLLFLNFTLLTYIFPPISFIALFTKRCVLWYFNVIYYKKLLFYI